MVYGSDPLYCFSGDAAAEGFAAQTLYQFREFSLGVFPASGYDQLIGSLSGYLVVYLVSICYKDPLEILQEFSRNARIAPLVVIIDEDRRRTVLLMRVLYPHVILQTFILFSFYNDEW